MYVCMCLCLSVSVYVCIYIYIYIYIYMCVCVCVCVFTYVTFLSSFAFSTFALVPCLEGSPRLSDPHSKTATPS